MQINFQLPKLGWALKHSQKMWSVAKTMILKNNNVQQSSGPINSSRGWNELDDEVMNLWMNDLTKANAARKALWEFISAER